MFECISGEKRAGIRKERGQIPGWVRGGMPGDYSYAGMLGAHIAILTGHAGSERRAFDQGRSEQGLEAAVFGLNKLRLLGGSSQ